MVSHPARSAERKAAKKARRAQVVQDIAENWRAGETPDWPIVLVALQANAGKTAVDTLKTLANHSDHWQSLEEAKKADKVSP